MLGVLGAGVDDVSVLVVLGMTTLPAVSPGEPVCNLGRLPDDIDPTDLEQLRNAGHIFEDRISEELGSNIVVVKPPDRVRSSTNGTR